MARPTDINSDLTVERLDQWFAVDPAKGLFIWKGAQSRRSAWLNGRDAGALTKHGYIQIKVDGRFYRRSRLMWFYVHGRWPADLIDHVNGTKTDDRIDNLREADASQNQWNAKRAGIDWHHSKKKWRARITAKGRTSWLGYFDTANAAAEARRCAETEVYGDFARAA